MPPDPEQPSAPGEEAEEKQLCVNCTFPNDPLANFCAKCGAPLTSYAATGPLEHIFAEGHAYRQAVERPRSFIVVIGIWLIFGVMAATGLIMIAAGGTGALPMAVLGVIILIIPSVIILRTTTNYFTSRRASKDSHSEDSDIP
jgi:hypothetical protein